MIFDTGQTIASRYQLNCRGSGVESHQNLGQDLLTEKTLPAKATWLSVTLNNINSCSEVWASGYYLIKNNKITAEEQGIDKLRKLYLERKATLYLRQTNVHHIYIYIYIYIYITYFWTTGIEHGTIILTGITC